MRPPAPRRHGIQRLLCVLRRRGAHPVQPVRNAVHVRVHADMVAAAEGDDEHEVRRLAADTGQRQQCVQRARHDTAESRHQLFAGGLHMDRLLPIEADGIDQPLDRGDRQARHRCGRRCHGKQPRGRGQRRRILRARRQQGRDQHLERAVLLLLGDLLDRGEFHARDGGAQGTHHGVDRRGSSDGAPTRLGLPASARARGHHRMGVSGERPDRTAATLSTASCAMAVRVPVVPLPRCGTSNTFSSASNPGCTTGSSS